MTLPSHQSRINMHFWLQNYCVECCDDLYRNVPWYCENFHKKGVKKATFKILAAEGPIVMDAFLNSTSVSPPITIASSV
jgi:hypothetical protein